MPSNNDCDAFLHLQDTFGNVPMVKRYTLLCLLFTLSQNIDTRDVETNLREGLDRLGAAIPHLKGHVVFEGRTAADWGRAKILPLHNPIPLRVKYLVENTDFPSLGELRRARFPISMLDSKKLLPEDLLPLNYSAVGQYKESLERPARVLLVQATFIRGGLVLAFTSNHTAMDMNGLGQTICSLAKACRGEPFTETEIKDANQSRRDAIPLFGDDYQPGSEAKYFTFQPRDLSSAGRRPDSPPLWANISFGAESACRLKGEASKQTVVPYISTNDAISAFLWQRIVKARSPLIGTKVESELNRQSSARKLFGLGEGYMGHMTASIHTHEVDVWEKPLGDIAGKLRQDLRNTELLKFQVQAMATMLVRALDKTTIGYGASLDWDRDVVASSYAEIKCCQVSFGPLLGFAEAARRPTSSPAPGCFNILPKDKSGDLVVAVSLREDEMLRMRDDPVFAEYAEYVG